MKKNSQTLKVPLRVNPKSLCNYFLVLSVLLECCRCRENEGGWRKARAGNKKQAEEIGRRMALRRAQVTGLMGNPRAKKLKKKEKDLKKKVNVL